MKELIKITKPNYCRCCWRPVTQKNKRGRLESYCNLHKPSGESKKDYMSSRRMLKKWMSERYEVCLKGERSFKHGANIDESILTLAVDPNTLNINEIKGAKAFIEELLKTTSAYYPHSYKKLKPMAEHINVANLTIDKVRLLTHFELGTKTNQQLESEVSAYDLRKESEIWFTQLLFTIARFEALAAIEKQTSARSVRSDKNQALRSKIYKELELAKSNNKEPNHSAIARKLNLSKQRISRLVKELTAEQKVTEKVTY